MRILLDQGLARSVVELLEKFGHEGGHVADLLKDDVEDGAIVDFAMKNHYVIVTFDADYHAILAQRAAKGPSVIRIRIEGLKAGDQARVVARVVERFSAQLEAGAAVTVHAHQMRLRLLPLKPEATSGTKPKV